jgi:hypothetical protein
MIASTTMTLVMNAGYSLASTAIHDPLILRFKYFST